MVQKINFRFNGTQAQFYSTRSYIITLVEQNLDLFKKFGTTEDQLNEAKKCLQKYDTATPDMAMRLNQANISVNKNKLVENLKNELRYVNAFLKVNLTLSPQNDFYVLNIKELSRLRSKEISNNTKKLMQSIENYNNSIENYELIQDNINTINDLYKQIAEESLNDIDLKINFESVKNRIFHPKLNVANIENFKNSWLLSFSNLSNYAELEIIVKSLFLLRKAKPYWEKIKSNSIVSEKEFLEQLSLKIAEKISNSEITPENHILYMYKQILES